MAIWQPSDLEKIDAKTQAARIAHTVGERKRVLLIEEAKKRNIRILNPRAEKAPETEIAPEAAPETVATEGTEEPKKETAKEEQPTKAKKRKAKRKSEEESK